MPAASAAQVSGTKRVPPLTHTSLSPQRVALPRTTMQARVDVERSLATSGGALAARAIEQRLAATLSAQVSQLEASDATSRPKWLLVRNRIANV